MEKLILLNCIILALLAGLCTLAKRFCKTERAKNTILLSSALLTVLCHYSSLLYEVVKTGTCLPFLTSNPNLILPIYPCNAVMWCCLILGLMKNKTGKFACFLIDYVFWFGILSCLVGLFANVDFIRNPTLADFHITKGILAHGFMLWNVLLLAVLGYVKVDLPKNMLHVAESVVMMLLLGLYCNLVFTVLSGKEMAYLVNSMFLIHSPFEEVEFLKYPLISAAGLVFFFLLFCALELIFRKKGDRWTDRLKALIRHS